MEALPLLLFLAVFLLILWGFPVAFTLGGVAVLFGLVVKGPELFFLMPLRINGTMQNFILIAVPLFVYMGVMLERSGIAERLLGSMAYLFGRIKGGLAISVVAVGTLLAASTGIVGATVVTMGLLSLPTMLKRGYAPTLATGTIASSGTLGQIIPPSIVLVLLGSVLNVPVGDLFIAAVVPGLSLVLLYVLYIVAITNFQPEKAPALSQEALEEFRQKDVAKELVLAFVLPMTLIIAVLGSIFAGIASPTEAAGIGAFGATILTIGQRKFNLKILKEVMTETTHITCMVFIILVGATAFGLVFRDLGGDTYLIETIEGANLSPQGFLILVMVVIFVAGFFIDFIEITFIIVPIVAPVFQKMGIDLVWLGILIAINLQTSFLTPPFGFALFYLKGVAPKEVTTGHIYQGILPFVLIQILMLSLLIAFPELVQWLPEMMRDTPSIP